MNETDPIISREQVSERFEITSKVLLRYEARGLIHSVKQGEVEGYETSEVRRIWTVVSLHRDLGINLAGIEAIVKLRTQMNEIHAQLGEIAGRLKEIFEERGQDAESR